MHGLYILSVTLHILAASLWVGGMLFLALVLMPALRRREEGGPSAADLLHRVAVRFRALGWAALALLVLTGAANLALRGIGWADVLGGAFWAHPFGRTLGMKLLLVAAVLLLSAAHDFSLGPRATALWRQDPARAARLRRGAAWMGRVNLLLSLIIVALAVMLVRGAPWW